jgi:hypothetical protein
MTSEDIKPEIKGKRMEEIKGEKKNDNVFKPCLKLETFLFHFLGTSKSFLLKEKGWDFPLFFPFPFYFLFRFSFHIYFTYFCFSWCARFSFLFLFILCYLFPLLPKNQPTENPSRCFSEERQRRLFHPAPRIWPILISLLRESKPFPCVHLQEKSFLYLISIWPGRA